jgi:hypothetical protein
MPVNLVIILAFFLILLIIALIFRNSTLDRLKPIPGEKTIFEEDGITVEQRGTPRIIFYGKCRIRVTGARIIIAQKILFMKNKYMLRFVMNLDRGETRVDLPSTLKSGYYIASIDKNQVDFKPEGALTLVKIPIGETRYVQFATGAGNDYRKALAGS